MTDTPPKDYDRLLPWFSVIREANSITVGGSVQCLSITVWVDKDRRPLFWVTDRKDMHPRYRNLLAFDEQ